MPIFACTSWQTGQWLDMWRRNHKIDKTMTNCILPLVWIQTWSVNHKPHQFRVDQNKFFPISGMLTALLKVWKSFNILSTYSSRFSFAWFISHQLCLFWAASLVRVPSPFRLFAKRLWIWDSRAPGATIRSMAFRAFQDITLPLKVKSLIRFDSQPIV